MGKFTNALFLAAAVNTLLFVVGFLEPAFFVVFLAVIAIEFLVGFILLLDKDSRQTGGGIMTAAAITLLIGFSVCSTMM